MKKISCLLTVHNKQDLIQNVCEGIKNNISTLTDQIVVVLDGCSDNSESIVKSVFNDLKIKDIKNGNLNEFTFFGPFSQAYLKAAAPDYKFGLNLGYSNTKFDATVSLTQFSDVTIQDFQWVDSPATNQAEADALYDVATDLYKKAMVVDLSLGYKISENVKLNLGANNLFNKYPTPQFDGWTDQGGLADSVQMGSDGMYIFSRLSFSF